MRTHVGFNRREIRLRSGRTSALRRVGTVAEVEEPLRELADRARVVDLLAALDRRLRDVRVDLVLGTREEQERVVRRHAERPGLLLRDSLPPLDRLVVVDERGRVRLDPAEHADVGGVSAARFLQDAALTELELDEGDDAAVVDAALDRVRDLKARRLISFDQPPGDLLFRHAGQLDGEGGVRRDDCDAGLFLLGH